ncbi:MAG: hypothetical protein B7Z26_01925, partial [Asticcacaulis sp. 32-58-5]
MERYGELQAVSLLRKAALGVALASTEAGAHSAGQSWGTGLGLLAWWRAPPVTRPTQRPFWDGIFVHAERGADTGQHEWLFWAPDLDASIVQVQAERVSRSTVGAFDLSRYAGKADLLRDGAGHEWLLLADEVGHVQLEVTAGSLTDGPSLLHFDVTGFRTFSAKLRTLARLDALHRIGRFPRSLFPPETGAAKWAKALQAYD